MMLRHGSWPSCAIWGLCLCNLFKDEALAAKASNQPQESARGRLSLSRQGLGAGSGFGANTCSIHPS